MFKGLIHTLSNIIVANNSIKKIFYQNKKPFLEEDGASKHFSTVVWGISLCTSEGHAGRRQSRGEAKLVMSASRNRQSETKKMLR